MKRLPPNLAPPNPLRVATGSRATGSRGPRGQVLPGASLSPFPVRKGKWQDLTLSPLTIH